MSKGRDFRTPRRRGFDDDAPPSFDDRPARPAARLYGGDATPVQGPIVDATVKWFNAEKGFGFAELGDGSGDAFLHIGALQSAGFDTVMPGAKLRAQVGQGAKGAQITRVIEVDESTAQAAPPRAPMHGSGGRPPRQTFDASTAVELTGAVKWFNADKGFGFVSSEDGGKDVFVHISILQAAGMQHLAEGQTVSMRVVSTPKGREAISISVR